MSVRLLMDVHVPWAVTIGLRRRTVDVLTAQEDGSDQLSDPALLDRAGDLGRVLFTQDKDLLVEAAARQASGKPFIGVIYAHQQKITIGQSVDNLEFIATAGEPVDFANKVTYLP